MGSDPTYFSFNHQHYSYLSRGIYIDQLQRWMNFFPREQFLILRSENLYSDSEKVVNQVFDFLGIPNYQLLSYDKYNVNSYPNIDPIIRKQLQDYFQPFNQKLTDFLGQDWSWEIPNSFSNSTPKLLDSSENTSSQPILNSVKIMKKLIMNPPGMTMLKIGKVSDLKKFIEEMNGLDLLRVQRLP